MTTSTPYIYVSSVALPPNGDSTIIITIGTGESVRITSWRWASTGAYSLTGISESSGRRYSDASPADPIPSTMLPTTTTPADSIISLPAPLVLTGPTTLALSVTDTSGNSNTVRVVLHAVRDTQ